MRLQDLKHLDAAMEALTACVDVDMLLGMLCARARDLFHMEAAFIWLPMAGEEPRLHRTEGAPAQVAARLHRLKITANGERTVARRLHQVGYRAVLAAPLRIHGSMGDMVAVSSQRSRRSSRVEAAIFRLLVRYAGSVLERWQLPHTCEGEQARRPTPTLGDQEIQHERTRLLTSVICGITHDLNNAMAAISGRVELLLHRRDDQATLRHLEAAQGSILEANHMIRHIHHFMSPDDEGDVVLVDINQLLRDSMQIATAPWFQGFCQTRDPIDLKADLQPVPALPGRASDLRIALLYLLRHAMNTLRPGGSLMVRTSSIGEDEGRTVVVSLSDDAGPSSTAEREEGIGLLLKQVHTPESQRAFAFVQATIYNLGGRITVHHSANGGTTTTLIFCVGRTVMATRSRDRRQDFTCEAS